MISYLSEPGPLAFTLTALVFSIPALILAGSLVKLGKIRPAPLNLIFTAIFAAVACFWLYGPLAGLVLPTLGLPLGLILSGMTLFDWMRAIATPGLRHWPSDLAVILCLIASILIFTFLLVTSP